MKKITKYAAVLLSVLMLASVFAACDLGEVNSETGSETQDTDTTAEKPTDAEKPSATETSGDGESEKPTDAETPSATETPTVGETEKPTDKEVSSDAETPTNSETEEGTQSGDSNAENYTVSVKTVGGRPIPNLTLFIYADDDLVSYTQTDENGIATVKLDKADNYTVELPASSLAGYNVEERYALNESSIDIVLTSSVIPDSNLTGVTYKVGDIMRDFTVTLTDGSTFTLSEVLKEKKGVLINFWFSTCSPCISEFPYMNSAYEKFKDNIEVIALNNYPTDNEMSVKSFKDSMGLTFPVARDYSRLGQALGVNAYPTSIFVDRYGVICLIEAGAITSEKPFTAAFRHFSAEDYEQKLFTSLEELVPAETPNIEMPSSADISAAVNGSGFTAEYFPETDSADSDLSWPFLIGEKDGKKCIYPANSEIDSSFATLHANVELKKGEAIAVDWFSDTELAVDILYILVNGKDIYKISGVSEAWSTCYPFVAVEDGTYKISFVYLKDDTTNTGTDRVYLSNIRKVTVDKIDTATYIPRQAATNKNPNGLGYQNYITPVFNETDGYYHVGSANGPLILVDLMGSTQLSEQSLNDLGYNGSLVYNGEDLYVKLVNYCNYAINGTMYGFSPVTEELKGILEKAAELVGYEIDNPLQWLQACVYYDAYGTEEQLSDPVKGVAFFAAYDTVLSTDTEEKINTVTYDGRVIMPRGLKYKFVPEKSGVYIIRSNSENEVNGWIFNDAYEIIHTAEVVDRPYTGVAIDTTNVTMVHYLEAGKTYYIDIAYYDIYAVGTFTFTVKYIAESYDHFKVASPGYFTFEESIGGGMNETLAGGIDIKLGDDGYYHELRADGTLGSIVYADFKFPTSVMSHSILEMIELGGFNFSLNEYDHVVLAKLKELGGDIDACREYYRQVWGDEYEYWAEEYKLEDVLAGVYHGEGEDLTEAVKGYIEKMIPASEDAPELEGCVAVDEGLASILQALMDKYSFKNVSHSWTKLCYYYDTLNSMYN